jgi:hypothetical protein
MSETQSISPSYPSFAQIGLYKDFFQWSEENHIEFLKWWQSTEWTLQAIGEFNDIDDLSKKLSWNSKTRTSDYWLSFDQAANRLTGEPALICRNCSTNLAHPNTKNTGTKAMKNHLASAFCRQKAQLNRGKKGSQRSIQESLSEYVSLISIKININANPKVDCLDSGSF